MPYAARVLALVAALGLGSAPLAVGQTCFRGRPQPRCSGFTVLEVTGGIRLNDKSGSTDGGVAFIYWSGGYLRNISSKAALGAAFKLTADTDGHRYGPVVRYRRWLGSTSSIDFSPGVFVGGKDNRVTVSFPSPTADVAVNYGDLFGVAVGVDALRQADGGTQWQWHAGVRFGTWLAPRGTLGFGLLSTAGY